MKKPTQDEKKEANHILDLVKVGWPVPDMTIAWALIILGDLIVR